MKATGKITKTEGSNPLKITLNGSVYSVWRADLKTLCKVNGLVTLDYHETKRDNKVYKNVDDIKKGLSKEPITDTLHITEQLRRSKEEINREVALREAINFYKGSEIKPLSKEIIELARLFYKFLTEG